MISDKDIEEVIDREGGAKETHDPLDKGGRTKFGIAEKFHPEAWADGDVTHDEAVAIYKDLYVHDPGIDRLPAPLDENVFDFAVTSGAARAVRILQTLLHTTRDGKIGPETLRALQARDLRDVNNLYCAAREAFYRDIVRNNPSQQKWLKGWVNRAKKFFLP